MSIGVPLFAVLNDEFKNLVIYGLKKHNQESLLETYNNSEAVKNPQKKGKTIYQRLIEMRK